MDLALGLGPHCADPQSPLPPPAYAVISAEAGGRPGQKAQDIFRI